MRFGTWTLLTVWLLAATLLGGTSARAHRGAHGRHGHGDEEADKRPTPEQIEQRLARVKKRAEHLKATREQVRADRKRALRKRLYHRLGGGALTDEARAELKLHAQRTARIRHIRYMAALENDFESVIAADKVLARENARHEAWWRKAGASPAAAASAAPTASSAPPPAPSADGEAEEP